VGRTALGEFRVPGRKSFAAYRTTSIDRRETRRRSLPVESTIISSVIAGHLAQTGRKRVKTGDSRGAVPDHGNWVVPAELASRWSLDELADLGRGGLRLLVLDPK